MHKLAEKKKNNTNIPVRHSLADFFIQIDLIVLKNKHPVNRRDK